MSKKDIYKFLRLGGLSRAGALGMMGNIGAESAFNSHAVEHLGRSQWDEYVSNLDRGYISREDFVNVGYGFGLAQWTLPYRKHKLWIFAYMSNDSIGDEYTQTRFIIQELATEGEYANLYKYLCETSDMYNATARICREYERPAVNNIDVRYNIACECANEPYDDDVPPSVDTSVDTSSDTSSDTPSDTPSVPSSESCDITVRVLRQGDKGRDVFLLQNGLSDMGIDCGIPDGDFGPKTEAAVNQLKLNIGLEVDGIANADVWQVIFQ